MLLAFVFSGKAGKLRKVESPEQESTIWLQQNALETRIFYLLLLESESGME